MKKYVNVITGAVLQTNSICHGANWQEVTPPAKAPAKEKVSRTKVRETEYPRKEKRNELRYCR